jgi:5S rRNA maturation endonuclease (ribonuclease M5)
MVKKVFDLFSFFEIDEYYESHNLLISSCPVHEGDNVTAFNINIDEDHEDHCGKWFCNTQGCHNEKSANDIISLVWMLLENKFKKSYKFPEVVKFCQDFCSGVKVDISTTYKSSEALDKLLKNTRKVNELQNKATRSTVRKYLTFPPQHYINRGFSQEALDLFDVGLCTRPDSQMYKRIVFPVYDENDEYMVGCVGRTIGNDPRKWINQKGFNKSNFLYNYGKAIEHITRSATIILAEGQGDVIRLWESGIRNAVGIFGSKISDAQEFLIQKTGVSNVIIMSDNDKAGDACKKDIHERLKLLFNIYTVELPKNDIGDMSVNEVNEVIKPQIQGKF